MNILVFGGTTEGRLLARALCGLGARVTVSVATPLGREELFESPLLCVWVGRKDAGELAAGMAGFDLCIDATHPYAVEATANIQAACRRAGLPLRRLLREETAAEGVVRVDSCRRAAEYLAGEEGNILLTTGAKELAAFGGLDPRRIYARVLPTHEGLAACERLGLPHRNILALQGPFSRKLNEAMLEQYRIRFLVTKDGGRAGGAEEKLAAARAVGARVVLVGRPPERGESLEQILEEIKERL